MSPRIVIMMPTAMRPYAPVEEWPGKYPVLYAMPMMAIIIPAADSMMYKNFFP